MPCNRAPQRLSSLCGQFLAPRTCAAAGEDFTITPVPNCSLGAYVRGLSLAEPLSPDAERRVKEAFLKHAVLIFEGQEGLTVEQQIAFGKLFGKLEFERNWLSNQRQSGEMIKKYKDDGPDDGNVDRYTPQYLGVIGNHAWHQDSTYLPVAAKAGIIYAEKMPPPGAEQGGGTEWMDLRAAYEALDEETKARVEKLSAYHSGQQTSARRFSVFPKQNGNVAKAYGANGLCYLRPMVKVHPETGRKSLYIGSHAFGIPGMAPEEASKFLDELVEFAHQPQFCFIHNYRPGDLAIFDNRCLCHRGRPHDIAQPRQIRLTRIAGETESESALPEPDEDRARTLRAELERLRQLPAWDEEERSKHVR